VLQFEKLYRKMYNQLEGTMFGLGFQEMLLILLVALVIYGTAKFPEIVKALGNIIKKSPRKDKRSSS